VNARQRARARRLFIAIGRLQAKAQDLAREIETGEQDIDSALDIGAAGSHLEEAWRAFEHRLND
jgi:hypothetical protein